MVQIEKIVILLTGSTDKILIYSNNLNKLPFPEEWNVNNVVLSIECPNNLGKSWVDSNSALEGIPVEIKDVVSRVNSHN